MARTFSLDLAVALFLVFAITEASRGQINQVDDQKIQNRGSTRFHSKPTTESSVFFASSTRPSRDKNSRSEAIFDSKKHETHLERENSIRSRTKLKLSKDDSTDTSRTNVRYLNPNTDNLRNRSKPHVVQFPKGEIAKSKQDDNKENMFNRQAAPRKISSNVPSILEKNEKLDLEVFTKSPNRSRSRTGRKIYANYDGKESKSQVASSRKFSIKNAENIKSTNDESKEEARLHLGHSRNAENASKIIASRRIDMISTNNSIDRNNNVRERDVLLSGSESVRVDIPLTTKNDENEIPNLLTSATTSSVNVSPRQGLKPAKVKVESNDIARSSAKKNRQPEPRSKSRTKSNKNDSNIEATNSGSTSRRGSSKFGSATTEINGRSSNSRNRSNAKNVNSRNRTSHKSKDTTRETRGNGRNRYADTDLVTNAYGQTEIRRSSSNDRRTSEAKRRSNDGRSKVAEIKIQEQEVRTQSRSRSRAISNLDVTTAYIPKATIAETTTAATLNTEVTTPNSAFMMTRASTATRTSSSIDRSSRSKGRDRSESSRSKKPQKEDFFNHGLGFRGRKISTEGSSSSSVADLKSTTPRSETQVRGNPGWTLLRRRPSHVNHDSPTSINRDQANEIISSNDLSRNTETPLSSAKTGRRGTKRLKMKDESNTVPGITAKSITRGSKTFNKSESFGLPKEVESEESDNYPPAFRARLSQLKNSNSKPTGGKSTTRTSFQEHPRNTFRRHIRSSTKPHVSEKIETVGNPFMTDVILDVLPTNSLTSTFDPDTRHATKPTTAILFSERSKLKLDLARKLIKPELKVDENDFDVTTASYSGKSKPKEVSTVSESRNIEKTTKAAKSIDARIVHGRPINVNTRIEKSNARGRWKIIETRKISKDRNAPSSRPLVPKKSRVTSERTITSSVVERISMKSVNELNGIPRGISHRGAEEVAATTIDTTKIRPPLLQSTTVSREEESPLTNTMEIIQENSIITTIEPIKLDKDQSTEKVNPVSIEIKLFDQEHNTYDEQKETTIATSDIVSTMETLVESVGFHTTEIAQEVTLSPVITTPSDTYSTTTTSITTRPEKLYPIYAPNVKNQNSAVDNTKKTKPSSDTTKNSFRPRYTKLQPDKVTVSMVTSRTIGPTSRYIRKKSGVFTPYDAIPKVPSTEATQTKRREFRPRTATYRRHSEMPTIAVQSTVTQEETTGITITPKPTKYHANVKSSTPNIRSLPSEPFVSIRIDPSNDITLPASDITESSNGSSGNSNIFNPTRSAFLTGNTTTLLEQLRSTVAPLLNTLGNKSLVFSGAYSNVDTGNSAPRITPNGSPPRFSARYKGAELFVRKPSVSQSMVPSITTSSTTVSTPIENSGSAPPVDVVSPGEPRFVTFYQALESASIRNENLQANDSSQRQTLIGGVMKVDSNATVPNGASNDNANNDTASPIASNTTTFSPDSTTDITTTIITTTQSTDISLPSRLGTENTISDDISESVSTTSANSDPSKEMTLSDINAGETTTIPMDLPTTTPNSMIMNTLNVDAPTTSEPFTTEIVTSEASTRVDITPEAISSTESIFKDARSMETVNTNAEATELTSFDTTNANILVTTTSQNPQTSNNISDTIIFSSITESVTTMQIPAEITTSSSMSDISESIETNTIQSDETTPRTTNAPINMSENLEATATQQPDIIMPQTEIVTNKAIEDIDTNTIQQPDTTTSQTIESTSIIVEPFTTEEVSNDVTQTTPVSIIKSTFRTRLIDFAQDILSRLQDSLNLTTTTARPTVAEFITTTTTELSNAIPDSSSANTESSAQLEEATTAQETELTSIGTTMSLLNTEATTRQDIDSESAQTTTSTTNEMPQITRNTVGLDIVSPIAQNLSNLNMTDQILSSIVNERNTSSDLELTTIQNTRGLGNPSRNMINAKIVTTTYSNSIPISRDFVMENNPRSSNDTLLTELMSIAKTLFSEAINETRQLLIPNQITNNKTSTVSDLDNSIQINSTIMNNEKDNFMPSLGMISTPFKVPTSLESTSERIDVTILVDSPRNKTREHSNRGPAVRLGNSLMEVNAQPVATETLVNVADITNVMSQMSFSQTKIQTLNAVMSVTDNMNSELTTNNPDSQLSNLTDSFNNIEQQTTVIDFAQQDRFTTVPSNNVELLDRSSFITDLINNDLLTNSIESTTSQTSEEAVTELATIAAITEANVAQTNAVDTIQTNQTPNSIIKSTSDQQVTNISLITNTSIVTITLPTVFNNNISVTTDMSDIQLFTTESSTESVRNLVNFTNIITNQSDNITINVPQQLLTDFVSETPNLIARLQDTTATTAQRTAGSGIIQPEQTTETIIPTTVASSTAPISTDPSVSSESSAIGTTTISSSVEPTTAIATTTETATTTTTTITTMTTKMTMPIFETTSMESSSQTITTPGPMSKPTTPVIDINDNLVSTETTTDSSTTRGTTMTLIESEDLNLISRMDIGEEQATTTTINTTPATSIPPATTLMTTSTMQTPNVLDQTTLVRPTFAPVGSLNTGPYLGRFGGSQMTPVPRFNPSSKAPIRDYLIYGIYPNKTIVRKRPEDNLIDARNVDSPYVIFGIYPDGRLVRKFPNGTIIPSSRSPVEVVFTLSTTTTTNRPAPRPYYNQANQAGTYNQYQAPVYYNNRRPVDELTRNTQSLGPIDFGLIGNAIGAPPGGGPNFAGPLGIPGSVPSTNKMSDMLLNTRMGTLSNAVSRINNLQMPITNNVQTQIPLGPVIQDRDRIEASRTRMTFDQRNSVYIGQDKFINYQIDGTPDVNPKVVDLRINSVATSVNEGTGSSLASVPSFENLLDNQSSGVVTAPPGFPWRDPLDQIFGITTNSPVQTASVASNQLDEPAENNVPIMPRPISPLVEVFTPAAGRIAPTNFENRLTVTTGSPSTSSTTTANTIPIFTTGTTTASKTTATTATTITTTITPTTTITTTPTTITTTIPTTTTTTTPAITTTTPATTTTTTPIITTTTTPITTISTTTMSIPTTAATTTATTSTTTPVTTTSPRLATTASSLIVHALSRAKASSGTNASSSIAARSAEDMLKELQTNTKENVFGTTFGDLAFLNSLLQNNNIKSTTPKTLTEIEQMLANRILALALGNPGPTRSPKAIQTASLNADHNSIDKLLSPGPSSEPIIIDLLPYTSASSSRESSIGSSATTKRYIETNKISLTHSSTIPVTTTTKAPVVITAKPVTARPKTTTTTQAPAGFGVSLWRALFGNFFETTTSTNAIKNTKQKSTPKTVSVTPVQVTPKPTQTVRSSTHTSHVMSAAPIKSHTSPRSVDISDIQVSLAKSVIDNVSSASVTTPSSISTTRQTFLNNPNPRLNDIPTSTYSPEDDAKFLAALLSALQTNAKASTSTTLRGITEDDEAFLRAILSNQAISTTAAPSSTEVNPAALLALLLKQQGIEPSTPATKLREQLQLASLGMTIQSQPNPTSTTTRSTTMIINRPSLVTLSTPSVTSTRKTTSRPKIQTTTWSPSSTYPPPLFNSFSNFGSSTRGDNSGSGFASATRAFSQFLGAAITGAAQQLQSLLRNSTRSG